MLNPKQLQALELLTCGLGMSFADISKACDITPKTLWSWRNENTEFMDKLSELNKQRWEAAEDAARESCISLCREGNSQMVQFVLRNLGYNPTTKIDAEVNSNIDITIDND